METKLCISCKKNVTNDQGCVNFKCPNCGKYELIRCTVCRKNATQYTCPSCEFKGPN
ncbi:MAG: RNA-binding protein [Nanoarchaeota archaeon]|nr:RNA-binding protein [Nanoarchaeota archaeon]MBU1623000.1 RNA-binding protein [Nanoarchaeota archaeon]